MLSQIAYPEPIEGAIAKLELLLSRLSLSQDYPLSRRSIALLLLQKDPALWQQLQIQETEAEIKAAIADAESQLDEPLISAIAKARQQRAWAIEQMVLSESSQGKTPLTERLHQLTVNPWTGFPRRDNGGYH